MFERAKDPYVPVCPYCGGTEMIETYQSSAYGCVYASYNPWGACTLYHTVCRKCGSVVRSYVKDPEKLLKRKDRKEK